MTHREVMKMMSLDAWAREHHGLITRDASGLSDDAWRRAIRAGHLGQLFPCVARLPGTPDTPEQRIAAGVIAAGPGAMASHRSAAYLWGLVPWAAAHPVDVLLPVRTRAAHLPGVRVHRPTDHLHLIPQRRANIACTNVVRTLCDLGAVDPDAVSPAVGTALSDRLADLDALEATLLRHARPGRHGVVALRAAIDEWSIDAKPADSILEAAMERLVARHRLPPVAFHPVVEGWEVDFRVLGSIVLIECDGWATHGLRHAQFERDRDKASDLSGAGWIILRLTYRAIVGRPADTAARISRIVERWSHVAPPDLSAA